MPGTRPTPPPTPPPPQTPPPQARLALEKERLVRIHREEPEKEVWVRKRRQQGTGCLPETPHALLTHTIAVRGAARPRFEMCSFCHHVHRYNGTAMFTLSIKGTYGRHLIGKILCEDLNCSLRIRNLIEPSSYMAETLYTEARVWRMQKSMHRWLKKANRL